MLEEGVSDHRHKRMTVKALPDELAAAVNSVLEFQGRVQRAECDVVSAKRPPDFIRAPASPSQPGGALLEDFQHWEIKGRGVDDEAMQANFFVGRTAALAQISGWLTGRATDQRARVVTGGPGSGKSALLARIILDLRNDPAPPIARFASPASLTS
jgi:hypothetical protein